MLYVAPERVRLPGMPCSTPKPQYSFNQTSESEVLRIITLLLSKCVSEARSEGVETLRLRVLGFRVWNPSLGFRC